MISTEEAIDIVLSHTIRPQTETVDISQAHGRILSEDILADRDFPPFDRVMMDGIAINSQTWQMGSREFMVEDVQTAGAPQKELTQPQNCLEVMTGAILPKNTDVVIRYEDIIIEDQTARVTVEDIKKLQNIHLQGTDRKVGDILIHKNRILSPAEIAVLATVGKHQVKVLQQLKVAIVSTGDELVEVNETPKTYQIRKSNTYALQAALAEFGHLAKRFHLIDEFAVIEESLKNIINDYDVVILSGGVSKGKKDYVPEVLEKLEVKKLFHGVKQRPGKPFWFGIRELATKTAIFALPGNPVSTFMCFYAYTFPWLQKCYGAVQNAHYAILTEDFSFTRHMTYFLQVKLSEEGGALHATPVTGQGSGDLANLVEADAFIKLPPDLDEFKAGDLFQVIRYRQ